ncbi:1,4-alpha-glucan branching protein GlgB [Wenxinia marina]|uniref:1,4-alpha-glucan branching enzyme GlgB n=1 Tax=Wenxinia marina DSM 24838 TaxID=1123501 RepID=A0A0D0QCI5_9RHOB|nr:1,4-alpha-glucan branching protein GlgB [Wenxinia marina]KIQ70037.1 alpha-1,4-glucan:alpha-1,4-glucan 6-glycosyltransferase [Wenxinia marina DSM 24838]GGL63041.1 1,4-alpha-glucan branching enzyme GlgB [Wenxinia marina]
MTDTTRDTIPDTAPPRHEIEAILRGQQGDPFRWLGMHHLDDGKGPVVVNVFAPDASEVTVLDAKGKEVAPLTKIDPEGFFHGVIPKKRKPFEYRLRCANRGGHSWELADPYMFGPVLGEMDEYLLAEGRHEELYRRLGAHPTTHGGVEGTTFALWAPNARRVSVVGHFNAWDGRRHAMRRRGATGLWELFVPGIGRGEIYKYEIVGAYGQLLPLKADPVGTYAEVPPQQASVVHGLPRHEWTDDGWIAARGRDQRAEPISIYEVHLASWRRGDGNEMLSYAELGRQLIDYVGEMGFTHVEFLPVTEHPFSGSWGYQPVGMFAPTSRFGSPEDFAAMVDSLHGAGIGVIVDWVPAHFPTDAHGLGQFDGTALYEHADPRQGFHKDWNTLIYNFGRREVANFLRASATYWLKEFHVDALRVDAVASMLYLDYSRNEGEWVPNQYGGRENLDAIEFLKGTNETVRAYVPGALSIAEESTAWPGVSSPVSEGGLGFDFKWNMGWMHDTLQYMSHDPIHRRYHHNEMTFGLVYAFSENFVLPLSHDEVVHGKGSMLGKMPGDRWQKFANLRAYYGFMWGHPGKKLLFMGSEFGQEKEWNHDQSLDWHLLQDHHHEGVRRFVRDLNALYRGEPALHQRDCRGDGFQWIEGGDDVNNVFSFVRYGEDGTKPVVVISNMAPVVRENFRFGVPQGGTWREALNSDGSDYGGSGVGNGGAIRALDDAMHGQPASVAVTLPPLATIFLVPE